MIVFYVLMAVLTVVAVLGLSRPWWRRELGTATRRRDTNVAAYRQRLTEIEQERAAGLIPEDAVAALREEAGARLLDDAEAAANPLPAPGAAPRRRAALLLGLLLSLFAGGYYYLDGSWRVAAIVAGEAEPPAPDAASIESMLARLEQRLVANPDDVDGWVMLGRSRETLGRYAGAAEAYAKANGLTRGQEPSLLVAEGEALGLAAERNLQGRPRELFEAALAIEPAHPKALWYAGLAAAQAGDRERTAALWSRLRTTPELPDEVRKVLDEQLAELGVAPLTASPDAAADAATPAAVAITVSLSLAPELASKVPAGAQLIVYAKAQEGPPMPLAVVRQPYAGLPLQIRLDDTQAMMPSLKLSQFDRWEITARISATGQAKAVSGDLQGVLKLGRAQAAQPVALTIDTLVP